MKRHLLSLLTVLFTFVTTFATAADDLRVLVEKGDYEGAFAAAEPLRKKSPRDAAINYWYGRAALETDRLVQAREALTTAADRGYLDAYRLLSEMSLDAYDTDGAQDYVDSWRAALRKAKKSEPAELAELEGLIVRMSNQIDRVEDIPVIKKINMSRQDFDEAMSRINNSNTIKGLVFMNDEFPLFIDNSSREVFWTAPDDKGVNRLFTAGVLDDGTRDEVRELTEYIGDGDIMAPFMMEDGETLYFAASRDDSLGGYDLYMTRRDGEGGFYEPSNIGMPYNSPGDDLLFVFDENNNIGWWVTDRFTAPDSVSVMFFVPNKSRINIPSDAENIKERAMVADIAATQPKGYDLKSALARMPKPEKSGKNSSASQNFALSLGDGRIITDASQFRNREAARTMSEVLRNRRILDDTIQRLEAMRKSYAEGNTSLKGDIRALEAEVDRGQAELKNLTNRVIKLETTGH